MKRFSFYSLFFLVTLFSPAGRGQNNPLQEFNARTQTEVSKTLQKRDGLVIWMNRQTGEKIYFGNEALKGERFLPGSWMKLVTAQAAVDKGLSFSYRCTGRDRIAGKTFHCWTYRGHGELDLPRALGASCNLFFARLGNQLGWDSISALLSSYSFSEVKKISPEWLKAHPDDLPRLAIGDSPLFSVTPEETARFWDGFLENLKDPRYSSLKQGLLRAVGEGTASHGFPLRLEILGKTGTADSLKKSYPTHGWFLGAAPVEGPRWAVAVFLKNAYGFDEAANLGKMIFYTAYETGLLKEK